MFTNFWTPCSMESLTKIFAWELNGIFAPKWLLLSVSAEKFGYPRGQPCVLLKVCDFPYDTTRHDSCTFTLICNICDWLSFFDQVNQVFGWEPEPYYNITEVRGHSSMPKILKDRIGDMHYVYKVPIFNINDLGFPILALSVLVWQYNKYSSLLLLNSYKLIYI